MQCFGKFFYVWATCMKKSLLLFVLVLCANFTSCNKDDLEERNEELIIQIASLQRQLNDLSEDFSDLLTDNENKSSLIKILQNKIDELDEALSLMTDDYERSELENNDLYDEYLSIVNSKNELQAQLDNLVNEVINISCPLIQLSESNMVREQLFCTGQPISPIKFLYDNQVYSVSYIQDSIPQGIRVVNLGASVLVDGTLNPSVKDLFAFNLKFESDQCEKIERIVLARSPNSPSIEVSGDLIQSSVTGDQIQPIEITYGGSAEGLTFSELPEGLTYSIEGNRYIIEGAFIESGTYTFSVSTINSSGCGELSETISFDVEQAAQTSIPSGGGSGSGGGSTTQIAQYQLTVITGTNGSVSSSGGTYNAGTSISITASPDNGYGFVNWTDSSGNELSTNSTYTFNITSDTTITANYEELLFYLHPNGVTILCPNASVGAIGTVDGVQYTKVDRNTLIAKRNAGENLALVCTSGITDLSNMFRKMGESANSAGSGIGNWDTSSVTTIAKIFSNGWFNQDISKWDVSKVKNMLNAFNGAHKFDQDLSGWNTSSVENMSTTFRRAVRFKSDISGWNTSSVTDMRSFLKETEDFDHDLSGWTVNNVTQCEGFYLDSNMPEDKIPNFTNCNPD